MKFFDKRHKSGDSGNDKLKDFIKDGHIEDAEIVADDTIDRPEFEKKEFPKSVADVKDALGKQGLQIVAAALVAGIVAGFMYGRFMAPGGERFSSFDAGSLTRNVQMAKVERVKYVSLVRYDDVDVYDRPSDVSGTVIAKLGRDMKVEHLGLVPSLDTKENVGITQHDIKISRLFSKSFIIPAGTEVHILGYNGMMGEYDATVTVNGKMHSITVNSNEIKLPYTRGWVKVRTENGQEGYVYGETVSVRALK